MLLSEYTSHITSVISQFAEMGFIVAFHMNIDFRTDKTGLVKCGIGFTDQSKLFITEYVDVKYKVDKLSYSFHYQDRNGNLIFRYDNASHKPSLDFKDHKHAGNKISRCDIPNIDGILREITTGLMTQQS